MTKTFTIEGREVTFTEVTARIDGEMVPALLIEEEHDVETLQSIVANCCALPETIDDALYILTNEYIDNNPDIEYTTI